MKRAVRTISAGEPGEDRPRSDRLEVLGTIGHALGSATGLDELFRTIYCETGRILDTTGFILGLYDDASQAVTVVYQVDSGVELPGGSFPLGTGFTSQVIRTRQPKLIRRWSQEGPRVQIQYATDHRGLPESGITVPLLMGKRVIGVISVQSYRAEAYDGADLLTLQVIAGQTAVAIENLRHSTNLDSQLQWRVPELETILANMAEALLVVDSQGRLVRLNGAARKLLCPDDNPHGIVLGQPLDREQWGLWPLGRRAMAEAIRPLIESLRRGEACSDVEIEVRHDGKQVFSFSCAPLHDAAGAPAGGVIVFRDVTGRCEIERMKDEVLSIASHELRAPITVIKGQAQLLKMVAAQGRATPEGIAQGLSAILRQSDRLVKLLDLLLDLSRIEAGRLELQFSRSDLVAVTNAVVEGVRTTTSRHRLVVRAPERVEGEWDAQRLEQTIQNLLANAVKYSPEGGAIEVTIEPEERNVTVRVRDEGVGIPAAELPHLFERFYRAAGTRRLEGSGLGLYICEEIISAHSGRIWVESAGPGCGSTFIFTVPRWLQGSSATN